MRGYLRMWRVNLVALIVVLVFVGIIVLLIHLAAHKGERIYPGNGLTLPTTSP